MLNDSEIKAVENCLGSNFTESQKKYLRCECSYNDINECILPKARIEQLREMGKDMEGRVCGKTTAHIVKLLFLSRTTESIETNEIKKRTDYCIGYPLAYLDFYANFARKIYNKLEGKG